MPEVWNICLSALKQANRKHGIELINFVLMNNHYHLMLRTPEENLDRFMYELNKRISQDIRAKAGKVNQVFGGRYKWCLIQSNRYLANCYRYVYQNPLRAGIARSCEDYPYSTLHYVVHKKEFPVQIYDHFGLKDEYNLKWINEKVTENEVDAVRRGLRKRELEVLKDKKTRRPL